MRHKEPKPHRVVLSILLLAFSGASIAASADGEIPELRKQNKRLTERVEKQTEEIEGLKAELTRRDQSIAALQQKLQQPDAPPIAAPSPTTPKLTIQKSFADITITPEDQKKFQGTYIQLFSSRFNEVESLNLEYLFKKHGSKVARESSFDPFSADHSTKEYKTEIRYEFASKQCLATCNLVKRILEERYGLEDIRVIHESQYAYKGDRHYIEVYICDDLAGQSKEFKGRKSPLRFW